MSFNCMMTYDSKLNSILTFSWRGVPSSSSWEEEWEREVDPWTKKNSIAGDRVGINVRVGHQIQQGEKRCVPFVVNFQNSGWFFLDKGWNDQRVSGVRQGWDTEDYGRYKNRHDTLPSNWSSTFLCKIPRLDYHEECAPGGDDDHQIGYDGQDG